MNYNEWLRSAEQQLAAAGIGTARLDSLVLMEDATGKDRAWLLAHPDHELSPMQVAKLKKLLKRRVEHEPLAYIRGRAEFYGREFVLTPAVLQPRPESETMIDLLKTLPLFGSAKHQKSTQVCIADIGTGSGALGITAQLELPQTRVELIEIDSKALKIAQINVDKFTLTVPVIKSDLLSAAQTSYDVLLCNLPYVPDNFQINPAAMQEPSMAIFGGPDGLNVYRKLFEQLRQRPRKPLYILTEALPPQHPELAQIAAAAGFRQHHSQDFIQVFAREP